jgi:predicted Zn finger-like uncharacterized protein
MRLVCPECHARLQLPDSASSAPKVRCPRCGQAFAPQDDPTQDLEPEVLLAPEERDDRALPDDDDEEDDREMPRRRRRKQPGLPTATVVLICLGIGGVSVAFIAGVLGVAYVVLSAEKRVAADAKVMPPPVNTGVWEPDAALLPKLGPEVELAGYPGAVFRPPLGYVLSRPETKHGILSLWTGPRRADGLHPFLSVVVYTPRQSILRGVDLEAEMTSFFTGVKRQEAPKVPDLWRTPSERGEVNHQPFVRARLHGTDKKSGRARHGFIYITAEGATAVGFLAETLAPYEDNLGLLDASIMTFKKP